MTGETIKTVLEDVADNLFNPDPYLQQGGDMVRVGGLQYSIDPNATIGKRIGDLRVGGKPLEAAKAYKVAGWASVQENPQGPPVWDLVTQYLRERKTIKPLTLEVPAIKGMTGNPGLA